MRQALINVAVLLAVRENNVKIQQPVAAAWLLLELALFFFIAAFLSLKLTHTHSLFALIGWQTFANCQACAQLSAVMCTFAVSIAKLCQKMMRQVSKRKIMLRVNFRIELQAASVVKSGVEKQRTHTKAKMKMQTYWVVGKAKVHLFVSGSDNEKRVKCNKMFALGRKAIMTAAAKICEWHNSWVTIAFHIYNFAISAHRLQHMYSWRWWSRKSARVEK